MQLSSTWLQVAAFDAIHEARNAAIQEEARAELAARHAALGARALEGKIIPGSGKVLHGQHGKSLPVIPTDHHD